MKKAIIISMLVLTYLNIKAQDNYTLAYSGVKVDGVYVFVMAEPMKKYTYIATVKADINWTGTYQESFEKVIKKAKKKNPYFNGLIFQRNDLSKADLIKFDDLDISKGGIKLMDYVSFIDKKTLYAGEVIELEKDKCSVEYTINGKKKLIRLKYEELTSIDENLFTQIVNRNE